MFKLNGLIVFLAPFVWATTASANKSFPMAVNSTSSGESVIAAPASGLITRSGKESMQIKINNSCFGTNLRGVGNPVAPNSVIEAVLNFVIDGKPYDLKVEYPSGLVMAQGMVGGQVTPMHSSMYTIPDGGDAGIYGNTVIMNTKISTGVSIDNQGNINIAKGDIYLKSYSFRQRMEWGCDETPMYGAYGYSASIATVGCGEFMGKEGALSASFGGISVASDKSSVEVNVSFPGQTGFCGGYWSPLMVFFDDERPQFTNSSDFPLFPMGKTMWPEANSPGWFVAIDRDGNKLIERKDELFGDSMTHVNGFEALREFDTNKDGVIDEKDKDFHKLVLWQDKNGDGISQKSEMVKLSKMITKISLNYEKGIITPIGKYAEARERAKFWYKKDGKTKQGDIIDIWLSPAELKLSQNTR